MNLDPRVRYQCPFCKRYLHTTKKGRFRIHYVFSHVPCRGSGAPADPRRINPATPLRGLAAECDAGALGPDGAEVKLGLP